MLTILRYVEYVFVVPTIGTAILGAQKLQLSKFELFYIDVRHPSDFHVVATCEHFCYSKV